MAIPLATPNNPPPTPPSISDQLDSLLERYLTLLDTHQKLQTSAQADFRRGLFSLAEANFRNPNRTRYGQDLYDDKMQASLILEYPTASPSEAEDENTTSDLLGESAKVMSVRARRLAVGMASGKKATAASGEDGTLAEGEEQIPDRTEADGVGDVPNLPRDPIRQFGILVPPSLKAAQTSFSKATESWIESCWRDRELELLELEIRRARKRQKKANKQIPPTGLSGE